jgi:hypothetical protein
MGIMSVVVMAAMAGTGAPANGSSGRTAGRLCMTHTGDVGLQSQAMKVATVMLASSEEDPAA